MKINEWILNNCCFASKYRMAAWMRSNFLFASSDDDDLNSSNSNEGDYGKGLNFKELQQLHKLWYRINQFEGKFSDKAEQAREEAKADFYVLANKIGNETERCFRNWLYAHMLPGWWIRTKKNIEEWFNSEGQIYLGDFFGPLVTGVLAERAAKAQLEQYQDIDLEEYVRGNEISIGAMDFLASKGIETDAQFDDEALQTIVNDDGLLSEYTRLLRQNPDFIGYFNPNDTYGSNWFNASENEQNLFLSLLTDDIGPLAYEQFIKQWPGYINVAKNVQKALDRLTSAMSSPEDYNGVMTGLSLALNVAHNTGAMSEHVGLSEREMDSLSTMNMDEEDAKIKRYMSRLLTTLKV